MGRERKRGKLEDFNALLRGDDRGSFSRIVGDVSQLNLDPLRHHAGHRHRPAVGAGWRLVGAAAHPLNARRWIENGRRLIRVTRFSSRASASRCAARAEHLLALLAGEVGLDPYTRVVSDLYQDLFAETSFIGKGIYDVGAFRQLLDGRFPDNAVLSHDLLESCYARSGQCSDVELLEDSPSGTWRTSVAGTAGCARLADRPVAGPAGQRCQRPADLPVDRRPGVVEDLRQPAPSPVAPAYATLLALGWIVLPRPCRGRWRCSRCSSSPSSCPAWRALASARRSCRSGST